MKSSIQVSTKNIIRPAGLGVDFASQVMRRSGVNVNRCLHCRSCAGGCPFHQATDYTPNEVIRMVQFGLKKDALECSTIWVCVGCHTCAIQCPQAIDMAAMMDALRQIAIQEGAVIAEPDILNFHRDVLHTIRRYGRTHKLEIMLRHKARKWEWFSDLGVGAKMFAKRKMHFKATKVKNIDVVRRVFEPKPIRVGL